MLIQKDLEQKIIDAIAAKFTAALVDAPVIRGAWQTSATGLVKWIDDDSSSDAFLNVAVGCPQWQTYSTPVVDFSVNLSLFTRIELDPQGSRLAEIAAVIEDTLREWQVSTYQQPFTTLDLSNLSIDGLSLGGGSSPTIQNDFCTVSWTLTLSGSYITQT